WASDHFFEGRGFAEVVEGSGLEGATELSSWGVDDRFLFDGMIDWIDRDPGKPFYLMAWTDQTHHPYQLSADQPMLALAREVGEEPREDFERYLTLIHETDAQLGRLLDALRARGLADDTLVVVT